MEDKLCQPLLMYEILRCKHQHNPRITMNAWNNTLNLTFCFVFDDKIKDLKKLSCDFNRETYGSVQGKLTTV
jgi:hypothetical protein